jgi:hypothetical protein
MDERSLQPTGDFARLSADLAGFIAELGALFDDGLLSGAEAAE